MEGKAGVNRFPRGGMRPEVLTGLCEKFGPKPNILHVAQEESWFQVSARWGFSSSDCHPEGFQGGSNSACGHQAAGWKAGRCCRTARCSVLSHLTVIGHYLRAEDQNMKVENKVVISGKPQRQNGPKNAVSRELSFMITASVTITKPPPNTHSQECTPLQVTT